MNIITRASVKERIHVEQIIRSQPRMHNSDLVDIVTIPVRKCLGLSMDVYKPVGEVKEPLPIILDVHGGGLIAGRKEQNRNLGIQLARRGYIVKKQGQVAIKDLDEFLRFVINESDMRTYDDNYISILIPMKFDIDKVFGLDVCKRSDDDYVILYSCWYPNKDVFGRQFEMRLYHYDNSNDDDDLGLDIVMTQSQYDAVLQRFEEQYKKAYGVAIERGWENSLFDCCENEEEEI